MNPPSAWAVAKRDAPKVAEQLWTHGMPAGPKGRYAPFLPYFWGIWGFSKNKQAAKDLLLRLSQPDAVEKMVVASGGYDLPAFENLTTLKVWQEEGPPKGTLYHYPNPHNHQILSVAAQPAPPKIAVQIYTQAIHDQDDRALHAGRGSRKDAGLGRERDRRLHADLTLDADRCVPPGACRTAARRLVATGVRMVDAAFETPRVALARQRAAPASAGCCGGARPSHS